MAAGPAKNVLVLYDENKDFSGLALVDQSIKATLKAGMPVGLDVYTEYMDVSRFQEPGYNTKLRDLYLRGHRGHGPVAGLRAEARANALAGGGGRLLRHRRARA